MILFLFFAPLKAQELKILTKEEIVLRFESIKKLAIEMLLEAPDTLFINDSLIYWLSNMNIAFGILDSNKYLDIYHKEILKPYDCIILSNKDINMISKGISSDEVCLNASYIDGVGFFLNEFYIQIEDIPKKRIASTLIHELVHKAQYEYVGCAVPPTDRFLMEEQAWWFEGFIYAIRHPDLYLVPVPCMNLEEWRLNYINMSTSLDQSIHISMTACLRCPKEFVAEEYGSK